MADAEPIIRLRDVHKSFNGQVVLLGVDLDVEQGKTTVVIGPSGCGKSVLLKHIVGLLRPDRGKVFFHDHEVSSMGERALVSVRRQIGFVFQGGALFDSMTIEENITFPMADHGEGTSTSRRRRCLEVLSMVGLDGVEKKFPEELSGGQKKRVALARAIALNPEVILYDEPTTGLDPIRADLINELILKLQRELHTTAIVVTHDMASAQKVGDRVVMLYGGRFIADGAANELGQDGNETVTRFIQGRASEDELARLRSGRLFHRQDSKPRESDA